MAEILVEVRPRLSSHKPGQLSSAPAIPEPLANRLGELADTLKQLSSQIGERLSDLPAQKSNSEFLVDEIELKVSIDLESEAGVILARAKAGAGFEASIKWKRG